MLMVLRFPALPSPTITSPGETVITDPLMFEIVKCLFPVLFETDPVIVMICPTWNPSVIQLPEVRVIVPGAFPTPAVK